LFIHLKWQESEMKLKPIQIVATVLVALVLLAGAFSSGLLVGSFFFPQRTSAPEAITHPPINLPPTSTPTDEVSPEEPKTTEPPAAETPTTDLQTLSDAFWEVWQIVHENFVDQPLDDEALMRGAIRGMLDALGDPHTGYMDPDEYMQANIPLEGEYEGIGAWVDPNAEYLTIVSPMPGSPAEKAGLKPGDEVIAVDGEDMTGVDGNLVIRKVLGPAGTTVRLTIRREGEPEPLEFEIVRARITIPSLESRMLDNNIAYIQLFQFGESADQELRKALEDLLSQKPVGLILDLRNNGGGFLQSAVEVASEFISEGVILYEVRGDGTRDTYPALKGGLATEIPMVVLVNEGTASASEIVAGAIQDHNRGTLVGTTTFGKGSVQLWIPLKNDQGAVRVTIARWITPNEQQIQGIGLQPDIEVPFTQEDFDAGQDPQLDKAIELLLNDQ
jgi:carboxyl-terminal processing protease